VKSTLQNRLESGLSAIATALCGFTPEYGLLLDKNRLPNLKINVECELIEPVDYSILGDWIGKQIKPKWNLEYGPIPHIHGIKKLNFEAKKALTSAAANYGCPLLFIEGHTTSPDNSNYQAKITFTKTELERRYQELAPRKKVDSGHIGIAGSQTGIYPLSSPGGWNLIGKTPIDVFDIDNPTSSKIKMGDRLKFIPIDESKFENY